MSWLLGTVREVREETAQARTLVLDVPGWPGHRAGQHVDVRLTAADGYTAVRSYSVASAAGADVELTVVEVDGGEVSPYLVRSLAVGTVLELRGPLGGWFVWHPDGGQPVQLVAGGSGVVPLMAMLRTRERLRDSTPMRLLYSVRDPDAALYTAELERLGRAAAGPQVRCFWTRRPPTGAPRRARLGAADLAAATWEPALVPTVFVCGPTGFVEAVTGLLVGLGHEPGRIRTERFGGGGEP
ncbi:ferredoxin reductase [Nocardioides mesophilus]|uniref:ferredoxin reductase n=1 Tax=Nocardioides mesophilus TaxID=433659 RepID=UPI001FEB3812|nr:ferredoxin reductase [Nocardioides mesophilus]